MEIFPFLLGLCLVLFIYFLCGYVCFSGLLLCLFPNKIYGLWVYFLDLWFWFARCFNVEFFKILCAKIDDEWVGRLGLTWFGEEHQAWSSCSGEEEEQCSTKK